MIDLEYKNTPAFINDALPDAIAENDIYLFLDARKNSGKLITEVSGWKIGSSVTPRDSLSPSVLTSSIIRANRWPMIPRMHVGHLTLSSGQI